MTESDFQAVNPPINQEEMVAFLASEGYLQADIGQLLNMSQSTVSRHLAGAETNEVLVRSVVLKLSDKRVESIREAVAKLKSWDDLKRRLKGFCGNQTLASIDVIPTTAADPSRRADPWEARCLQFGRLAARQVADYLKGSRLVGVGYGRTLASVARGFPPSPPRRQGQDPRLPAFFPTWTEPYEAADYKPISRLFHSMVEVSSTGLAKAFSQKVRGSDDGVPALNCFPSLLPLSDEFDDDDLLTLQRFYLSNSSYRAVFDDKADPVGLVYRMDTALVGVGTTDSQGPMANPNAPFSNEAIKAAGFPSGQHRRAYLGDIGGVLLRRPPTKKSHHKDGETERYAARVEKCWMGLTFGQLRDCARNAKANGHVGVIALSVGRERRDAVVEAVRLSLINRLILDSDLAAALDESDQF